MLSLDIKSRKKNLIYKNTFTGLIALIVYSRCIILLCAYEQQMKLLVMKQMKMLHLAKKMEHEKKSC